MLLDHGFRHRAADFGFISYHDIGSGKDKFVRVDLMPGADNFRSPRGDRPDQIQDRQSILTRWQRDHDKTHMFQMHMLQNFRV